MKLTREHIIMGSVFTVLSLWYYNHIQKKQKKKGILLEQLQKKLHPQTKGVQASVALDPNYVDRVQKHVPGVLLLHPKTVDQHAKALHKAFSSFWGDDEQAIYDVLGKSKDKVHLSQVAKQYTSYDTIGLKQRIQSDLDTNEIKKVLSILADLAPYRTKTGNHTIEPNWKDPFDMKYTSNVMDFLKKTIQRIPTQKAKQLASKIKHAKGEFWQDDNEESIATVFKKNLQDKTQVSDLSAVFYTTYKQDLWEYLKSFLSDTELHELVTIPTGKLPNYTL